MVVDLTTGVVARDPSGVSELRRLAHRRDEAFVQRRARARARPERARNIVAPTKTR